MATLGELAVKVGVTGLDEFTKAMGTMSDRLKVFDKEFNKTFAGVEKVGDRLKGIGANLTAGITAPLGILGGVSVKAFGDFDAAMTKSLAIMGDVSQTMRGELAEAARQMAKESTFSAEQSAEALYFLASAGLDAAASIQALPVVTKFAQAGMFDMSRATDLLMDSQSALGLTIRDNAVANMQNMVRVSDVLVEAANKSNASVEQFAAALTNKAGAALRLVNKDIEEGVAVLAAFADQGTKGEEAGEKLSIVMRDLQNAAIGQKEEFKQFGIRVFDASGNLNNMADIVGDVEKALAGMSDEQKRTTLTTLGFQDRSVSAIQSLLGFSDSIRRYESDLRKAGGTTDEIAQKQLQTFNSQMILLKNRLTDAAISIGQSLVPMIQNLITRLEPAIQFVEGLAKSFGTLDPTIQTMVVALGAAAAAAGPLLFVAGQMITSFASVAKGIGALQVALGAGSGLSAVLTAATPLAIAFGLAIAGWAIYKAVSEIQMLERQMKSLESALASGGQASAEQAAQIRILEEALRRAGKEIPSSFDFDDNIKPVQQYIKELQAAAEKHKLFGDSTQVVMDGLKKTGSAARDTAKPVDDLKAQFDSLGKKAQEAALQYKAALAAYQEGKATLDQVTAAHMRLMQAQDAADPERIAKRHEAAYFDMLKHVDESVESYIELGKKLKETNEQVAASAADLAIAFGKAHEDMAKKAKEAIDIIVPLNKRLPEGIQEAIKHTKEVTDAYHQMGQKTPAELQKVVDENRKAWETIKADAGENSVAASAAWIKMREAEIEAARRSGQEITRAEEEQLRRAKDALDDALGKKKDSWQRFTQQVSTILNDLAKDFAASTIDLFKGLLGFDGFNKKLEEDSAKLREELADRTEAFNQFQIDTEAAIVNVGTRYAEQLAAETAELLANLGERRQEYERYASSVAEQLEELRGKEAERLAAEQEDLAEKLRDKEAAYVEYVDEVAKKEQEIRESHAKRLAEELRNLEENLRDRQQAYDDFVADANKSLGRIQGNLGETIEDATRGFNRKVEDENEDFARDQGKINEDIRKAELKGDRAQVAALRKQLAERTADHEKALRRMREDYEEQVDDAKRRAAEQTEDLKTNLDRRTRDHKEYVEENKRDQEEATKKHAEEQEKQLKDLHENLEKRTQDLIKFREETAKSIAAAAEASDERIRNAEREAAEIIQRKSQDLERFDRETRTKIDDLTKHYGEKQEEEVRKLNTEFGNKLKEYDTYRGDVEKKLAELEAAHKGPLDRIGEMFVSVFSSAGEALLRLLGEEGFGKLFKFLGNLVDDILPGVGKAISGALGGVTGGVTGGAGGAVGGAGSAGGGAASAAGGAASGVTSLVTAISGVVTAVASVAQFIQGFQMESGLDAIEHEVRYSGIYTREILEKGVNLYQAELPNIRNLTQQFLDQHAWRIHDVYAVLVEIRDQMFVPVPQLAEPALAGGAITIHNIIQLDGREIARNIVTTAETEGGSI